ncbi:hypothetical protein [Halomicronema sp. CCY15110]|uniref:hypothetical protein n=1 Tax=Halomicronema sp. CCY15110 TaxID=2767773 RepID=UPI00194EEBBA|nr:hypothetical protein [Halomicronema sp. CCY15110]
MAHGRRGVPGGAAWALLPGQPVSFGTASLAGWLWQCQQFWGVSPQQPQASLWQAFYSGYLAHCQALQRHHSLWGFVAQRHHAALCGPRIGVAQVWVCRR